MKTPVKKTKDWKAFIEAYPDRVIQNWKIWKIEKLKD
jgi:hypothetical protein